MQRKVFSAELKAKVALEALGGCKTVNAIAGAYEVHPHQVATWKREAQEGLKALFERQRGRRRVADGTDADALYGQIGRLQVQVEWLKKVGAEPAAVRWEWIEPNPPILSRAAQCELLGLNRSTWYDRTAQPSTLNWELMRALDEEYTAHPFYGSRRMTAVLRRAGYAVNRTRIMRLMRQMGLAAIHPKPGLSRPDPDHHIYPYLLRGVTVTSPNQVWSTDITYIRLRLGFVSLAAILDWYARSWRGGSPTPWRLGSALTAWRRRCRSVSR